MQRKFSTLIRSGRAQGMVEYILIVALIALIAVAGVKLFGGKISALFKGQAEKIEKEVQGNE